MVGRREFVRRCAGAAAALPASWLALAAILEAQVEIPSEFDTSLESIAVAFRGGTGMTLGYLSQPKAKGPHPGVVLLHDNTGLTTSTRGAARNLATSGYAVVVPDLLSPKGGVASFRGVDADVTRAVADTTPAVVAPQATGALTFVKSHGGAGGRGASLFGVGWGGTQALLFAAGRSDIAAGVAFYPEPKQALTALAKTPAPMFVILAADAPDAAAVVGRIAQIAVGGQRPHTARVFADTTRGFHDPGDKKAYKPEAAKQAWTAAIAHLDAHAKKAGRTEA
jgi:carboxymethylenebutenolidase